MNDNDRFDLMVMMSFNPDHSAMALSPAFSNNIRNAFFRVPKKNVDGVWMADIEIMRKMIDYAVSQAIVERKVSCQDFDKKFEVNKC